MTEAVDVVCRRENRLLTAEDDDRLKGTKHLWISSKGNVHPRRRAEFGFLRGSDLETARAWAIKENLRHLRSFRVEGWARRFFSRWSGWAMRSRLEPIKVVARINDRRLDNIITHCRHQMTNAVAERPNSKIRALNRRAGGYRNVGNFKTVISFSCGGLRVYP